MNAIIERIFRHKKINFSKLESFGFSAEDGGFVWQTVIADDQMRLSVCVNADGTVRADVFDAETGELYTLFLSPKASGGFVGAVRADYESALENIAAHCCEPDVYKSKSAQSLAEYAAQTYGSSLEFLWKASPTSSVLRRQDNAKWYCAFLTVEACKLGLPGNDVLEIADVRCRTEELERLIDGRRYFAGYHMNKKHWLTMMLDGSIPLEELRARLDESWRLAEK